MTRTLKALGLALLAVCAFGAVSASSASAVDKITCTNAAGSLPNCDITGEKVAGVTTTFGIKSASFVSITRKKESFAGTATNNATTITVTPKYEECSSPVTVTGCKYVLTGETTVHNKTTSGTETDARVKLDCGHTGSITIGPLLGCTIHIDDTHAVNVPVNQNLHGVIYDNENSANKTTEDVKVTITIDNIAYTAPGGACAFAGLPATGTDGFLTGSATAKGYLDNQPHTTANHAGIQIDTA